MSVRFGCNGFGCPPSVREFQRVGVLHLSSVIAVASLLKPPLTRVTSQACGSVTMYLASGILLNPFIENGRCRVIRGYDTHAFR